MYHTCNQLGIRKYVNNHIKHLDTHVIPWWQGSTKCCTAVGEYIPIAIRVIVVLPSFRRPRTFYLKRTTILVSCVKTVKTAGVMNISEDSAFD